MPVTDPEMDPTVAANGSLLLHAPPDVASLNVADDPTQTGVAPTMGAGPATMVIVSNSLAPTSGMRVIITVPAETPIKIPVLVSIVATAGLLLAQYHQPAVLVESLYHPEAPTHTRGGPYIAANKELLERQSNSKNEKVYFII